MSKAFTKEDDAEPERSTRMRGASGLPPGAINYITADGARRLQAELTVLGETAGERGVEIARILASATVVEPPAQPPEGAVFGAKLKLRDEAGSLQSFRIVGADEVNWEPGWVSWTSPIGKGLLGTERGKLVTLEVEGQTRTFIIAEVEY